MKRKSQKQSTEKKLKTHAEVTGIKENNNQNKEIENKVENEKQNNYKKEKKIW